MLATEKVPDVPLEKQVSLKLYRATGEKQTYKETADELELKH